MEGLVGVPQDRNGTREWEDEKKILSRSRDGKSFEARAKVKAE